MHLCVIFVVGQRCISSVSAQLHIHRLAEKQVQQSRGISVTEAAASQTIIGPKQNGVRFLMRSREKSIVKNACKIHHGMVI